MPLNFIVVIDHIYEGPIKFGAFIYEMVVITMQNGPLSPLDNNFIAAADQYCTGECSSHMLFVSNASE